MSRGTATTGFNSFTTSAAEKTAEAAKAAAQWEAAAKEAREGIANRRTT
ncbi:hypothetical protein [Streptomyces sp. NRRL F-525]|nr:hypothetical protein [Streptomyces sp. NRRL F-525]